MKVFVTGASGFVARHLRHILSASDIPMISASRTDIQPLPHETTIQIKDYTEDIIPNITGCKAAVHLVGSDDHIITNRIISLCKKANIPHIIYLSGLGAGHIPIPYFISKYNAELQIIKSKINYTIFRPSYIIGRDDYLSLNIHRQKKNGAIIIPGSGRYLTQPISIQDTVRTIMHAINHSQNRILDLVGPQVMSFLHLARIISGPDVSMRYIDMEKAYRQALLHNNPTYQIDDLHIMISGYTGDHNTLKTYTGMPYQTIQDAL